MTGHGTAIAGIINDIAPNAEIYSVRIMDAENKATLSRVVEGIYWCIENDIDIINMSFGTTVKSAVLEKAIQDANDAGILLISSAGNGDTQGVEYPAAYEEVIAVGAVNTSAQKTEEITVFKLGAIYPDKVFPTSSSSTNKNWHGGYAVNYIANYRFATRMAKYAGDTSKYSIAKGQSTDCFNQMKAQISNTKFGDKTYNQIFSENGIVYASKTDAQKKKLRKMFLYGAASHIVTDAFAHSAYCRCGTNGAYVKVSNKHDDDDPSVHPTRFNDAQEAMSMVIINYQESIMGSEIDFSPRGEDWGKKRGYCLRNVLKYAKEAAVDCSTSELNTMYKSINYEP